MAKKDHSSTNAPSQRAEPKPKAVESAVKKRHRPPLSWPWALGAFTLLLLLPTWAAVILSESFDWRFLATYFALISLLTFVFYWSDKRKAQRDQWRIPEGTLHLLELLGGWAAALLAQRFMRHKTKKAKYQGVFWLILFIHQLLSFEIVSGWWLSHSIWQAIQSLGA